MLRVFCPDSYREISHVHGDLEYVEDTCTYTRNGSGRFVSYIAAECVHSYLTRSAVKDDLYCEGENSQGDGGDLGC